MYETFEYVFLGIVVFTTVIVTMATIFPIAYTHISQATAYQLQSSSQAVLDQLLLTPGYPNTWGTDLNINSTKNSGLKSFGLGGGKRYDPIYVVDPNKAERLVNTTTLSNLYYIPPSTAAKIMGIDEKFGFSLRLKPVFNITSTVNTAAKTITVRIKTPEAVPIPNVNISVTLVRRNTADIEAAATVKVITDWNGTAVASFSSADKFDRGAYIILANYYGITTASVGSFGGSTEAVLIGDKMVVPAPQPLGTFIPQSRNPFYILGDKIVNGSYKQPPYTMLSNTYVVYTLDKIDGDVNAAIFVTKAAGQTYVVAAFRPPPLTYETGPPSGVHRYTVTRLVAISGVVFRVEFHLWRLAE